MQGLLFPVLERQLVLATDSDVLDPAFPERLTSLNTVEGYCRLMKMDDLCNGHLGGAGY